LANASIIRRFIMFVKSRLILFCMVAVMFALGASTGWATPNCTTTIGTGANETTVAVAANFVAAAKALITKCQTDGTCDSTTKYTICSDSTGNLEADMENYYDEVTGFTGYGYFFAADNTAAYYDSPSYTGTGTSWVYAKGVPVFFGYKGNTNIGTSTGNLIEYLTGQVYTVTAACTNLSAYTVNTAQAGQVALADNQLAPYGSAGMAILNAMQPIVSQPAYVLPGGHLNWSWVHYGWYSSIGGAFSAVEQTAGTINSAFVGRSQVCDSSGSVGVIDQTKYTAVQFTDASCLLTQKAILLNSDYAAGRLDYYIHNVIDWPAFIVKYCYIAP
jgi:hypothetical protein